jgi:EAL domain-containing protein (putative c-di-GMP-specific phosphodiesterase class I)
MESKLRGAIARGELAMVYQPKVSLATGRITGCEALLRWTNPDLGTVPPSQFIPIAEESGLIVPIGNWALRSACAQTRAWLDAGLPRVGVSVNLSARQFLQQDVVSWVLRTLDETGLPPELLELELTESLIAQDTGKVIGSIDRLRSAGVRHSIDDFGTGYSSLAYLSRFKVDTLKIDQSFIRNMREDRHEAVIPIAVISLAHSLRLDVIAEGVETAGQCALLREHGCDAIQGYHFSPPVEAAAFAAMLAEGRRLGAAVA